MLHAGVSVLDVVHRVLAALLHGEVDVQVQRRVVRASDEQEARGVHADGVDEVVHGHDVSAPFAHPPGLTALEQVHELADDELERDRKSVV